MKCKLGRRLGRPNTRQSGHKNLSKKNAKFHAKNMERPVQKKIPCINK